MIVSIEAEPGPVRPDGWQYPIKTRATLAFGRVKVRVPIWCAMILTRYLTRRWRKKQAMKAEH